MTKKAVEEALKREYPKGVVVGSYVIPKRPGQDEITIYTVDIGHLCIFEGERDHCMITAKGLQIALTEAGYYLAIP